MSLSQNDPHGAKGNMASDQNGNTLVYDTWNRLVEVKDGSTPLSAYKYDATGRRNEGWIKGDVANIALTTFAHQAAGQDTGTTSSVSTLHSQPDEHDVVHDGAEDQLTLARTVTAAAQGIAEVALEHADGGFHLRPLTVRLAFLRAG